MTLFNVAREGQECPSSLEVAEHVQCFVEFLGGLCFEEAGVAALPVLIEGGDSAMMELARLEENVR